MDYFQTFKKSAFRLELLQKYDVGEEQQMFEDFLKTGEVSPYPDWEEIIIKAKERGAEMSRVHVLEYPLSDYLKFELKGYENSQKAGEKILLIDKPKYDKLNLGELPEFWLFDDEVVLIVNYTEDGKFLGFKEINSDIEKYVKIKEILSNNSAPLKN